MVISTLNPGQNEPRPLQPQGPNDGAMSFLAEDGHASITPDVGGHLEQTRASNEDDEVLQNADGFNAFNTAFSMTFEEWLNDYSSQDLEFFGFNGFYPT